MTTTTTGLTYATAPNKVVRGGNAIDYAYREAEEISGDHEFSIDHLVAFAS